MISLKVSKKEILSHKNLQGTVATMYVIFSKPAHPEFLEQLAKKG